MLNSKKYIFLFLCLILACSSPTDFKSETPHTPKADKDAELMALYLSGSLYAPSRLYWQVSEELKSIRSTYAEEIQYINKIHFNLPWRESCILVAFDDTTGQKIDQGEYTAWDDLNTKYSIEEIEKLHHSTYTYVLNFKGRLHSQRLVEIYRDLPGITNIGKNRYGGDFSNIYPKLTEHGITYLFRHAWGDCLNGCLASEFWYFIIDERKPILIGYWYVHDDNGPPEWWNEAKYNWWDWFEH